MKKIPVFLSKFQQLVDLTSDNKNNILRESNPAVFTFTGVINR